MSLATIDIKVAAGPVHFTLHLPMRRDERISPVHIDGSYEMAMMRARRLTRSSHVSYAVLQATHGFDLVRLKFNGKSTPPLLDDVSDLADGDAIKSVTLQRDDERVAGVAGLTHDWDLRNKRSLPVEQS
jgi:hypothetical protein